MIASQTIKLSFEVDIFGSEVFSHQLNTISILIVIVIAFFPDVCLLWTNVHLQQSAREWLFSQIFQAHTFTAFACEIDLVVEYISYILIIYLLRKIKCGNVD
jgi:hypothetical protein